MGLKPNDIQGVTLEELRRIRGDDLKPVPTDKRIVTPRSPHGKGEL